MNAKNKTVATEFILLGFTTDLHLNIFLFVLFLAVYIVTLTGNCLIMWMICFTPHLHRPMYFYLCVLSFLDLCLSTSVVPRLLVDFLSTRRSISLAACSFQFYTAILMAGTESLLLALMAYDRYVAICRPLHYPVLMSWRTCHCLTALVWVVNFMLIMFQYFAMSLDLCYPNQINHFMCEAFSLMQLACEEIFYNEVLTSATCFSFLLLPFVFIFVSYTCIISSVLKIPSAGRSKAFSTCTSHITVVILNYGIEFILYFSPSSQYSMRQGKYLSLFSFIICPALNPIIYTLNNKEFKDKMKKVFLKSH